MGHRSQWPVSDLSLNAPLLGMALAGGSEEKKRATGKTSLKQDKAEEGEALLKHSFIQSFDKRR